MNDSSKWKCMHNECCDVCETNAEFVGEYWHATTLVMCVTNAEFVGEYGHATTLVMCD